MLGCSSDIYLVGNEEYTLEELFAIIHLGSVAGKQSVREGGIPTYPRVVVTGEGWGRGWKIDLDIPPGTLLDRGVHSAAFSVRVAPWGEKAVTARGRFFLSVGEGSPPPRSVTFTYDDGTTAPSPDWATQLPTSYELPLNSFEENRDLVRWFIREADTAREAAALMCRPAVVKYARERSNQLRHLPSTNFEDITQAAWLTACRGIDLFSGDDRPPTGFGHWLYLEARKAVQRTIAHAEGLSEEVRSIRNIVTYAILEDGSSVDFEKAHQALLMHELISEAKKVDGLKEAEARVAAEKRMTEILQWEDDFQREMSEHLEWLENLGSMQRDRFEDEVIQYLCAGSGMTLANSRSEIVAWLYSNIENSAEATLAVSGRPKPARPDVAHSTSQIQYALTHSAPASLDEIRDAGIDIGSGDEMQEFEMAHYIQEQFSECGVNEYEALVFLAKTNVLSNGQEETWPAVAELLGVSAGAVSERHLYRALGVLLDSARDKLSGGSGLKVNSAIAALTKAAAPGGPWVMAGDSVQKFFQESSAFLS